MDNEVYRVLSHSQLIDEVIARLVSDNRDVYRETRLPNGLRPDVISVVRGAWIIIVECKTVVTPSIAEAVTRKYYSWADAVYIATEIIPRWVYEERHTFDMSRLDGEKAGWLQVSAGRVTDEREPIVEMMADNRRRMIRQYLGCTDHTR